MSNPEKPTSEEIDRFNRRHYRRDCTLQSALDNLLDALAREQREALKDVPVAQLDRAGAS